MSGASKILTVSYGTFSCTLEGFEDPFNTMKAIAEYFRDLAEGDRYFGAEPPVPDTAMLHRIAEGAINRRVQAQVQDNGVVLRTGDAIAPDVVAQNAPAPLSAPTPPALTPPAPALLDVNTAETLAAEASARLERLRAEIDEKSKHIADLEQRAAQANLDQTHVDHDNIDHVSVDQAAVNLPEDTPAPDMDAPQPNTTDTAQNAADTAMAHSVAAQDDAALQSALGADGFVFKDDAAEKAAAQSARPAPEAPIYTPIPAANILRPNPSARVQVVRGGQRLADAAAQARAALDAGTNPVEAADASNAIAAETQMTHTAALADDISPAPQDPEPQPPRSRIIRIRRVATQGFAPQGYAPHTGAGSAARDIEFALPMPPQAAPAPARAKIKLLEETLDELLQRTNANMADGGVQRRQAAMAHMKAAAAATEADRSLDSAHAKTSILNSYRNDLGSIAPQPAQHTIKAPLVLVSEQRVAQQDQAQIGAVAAEYGAPKLVENIFRGDEDELEAEDAASTSPSNIFTAVESFEDFADRLGVTEQNDVMEAAAIYVAHVEKQPLFRRRQLMRHMSSLPDALPITRESSLAVFNELLGNGRISEVEPGLFAVTDRSPLLHEAMGEAL
jgi:hypothetical protein